MRNIKLIFSILLFTTTLSANDTIVSYVYDTTDSVLVEKRIHVVYRIIPDTPTVKIYRVIDILDNRHIKPKERKKLLKYNLYDKK